MTTYEHLTIDDRFDCGRHRFSADEIKRFANAYDWQPFHIDEEAAAKTHFGALCASGWQTAAIMMRHFVNYFIGQIEAAGARGEPAQPLGRVLGYDDLKWIKPVYVDDEINYSGRIVGKRDSDTQADWGIVSIEFSGVNQHGDPVFACTGHFLVAKRGAAHT